MRITIIIAYILFLAGITLTFGARFILRNTGNDKDIVLLKGLGFIAVAVGAILIFVT